MPRDSTSLCKVAMFRFTIGRDTMNDGVGSAETGFPI